MAEITVRGTLSRVDELRVSEKTDRKWCRALIVEERRKRTDAGEWVSDGVQFYNTTLFGRLAENVHELFKKEGIKSLPVVASGRFEPGSIYEKDGEKKQGNPNFSVNSLGIDVTSSLWGLSRVAGIEVPASTGGESKPEPKKAAPKKETVPAPKSESLFDDEDDLFGDDDIFDLN